MSDVKMSDVFNMLTYTNGREIDTGELVDSSGNWWATFNSKQAAMHAATAINSYDSSQELIAKLQADNELLREALADLYEMTTPKHVYAAREALAATKKDK